MKRVGTITYEFTEEEYNEIKSVINELDWAVDDNKTTEANELVDRLKKIFEV